MKGASLIVALNLFNAASIFRALATSSNTQSWLYVLSVVAIVCCLWLAVSRLLLEIRIIVRQERP